MAGAHEDGPTAKRSYKPDQHLGTRGSPGQNPGEAAAGGHGRVFTVNTLAASRASARTQFQEGGEVIEGVAWGGVV